MASAAAIVLTGGESRRMGTDKASLVVNGRSMLDHVQHVLNLAGVTRVVVAGSPEVPDPELDEHGPRGPLAGIVSGWSHLQTERDGPDPVLVLACDLPALTAEIVSQLVASASEAALGAIAHDGERPQPLIAAYRPEALDRLAVAFASGERSVRRCFADWDLAIVPFDRHALADADTPADLAGFDVDWPKP